MTRLQFLLGTLGLFCAPVWAATSELLTAIAAQIEQHPVVQAEFVQTKKMTALRRPFISRGRMVFSRQDGLFWWIEEPLKMGYWLGEAKMVEILPNGERREQATASNPALAQISRVMRSMLAAQASTLVENFDVHASGRTSQWVLTLVPKQAQLLQHVRRIQLSGGRFIEEVILVEPSGDSTQTRFFSSEAMRELPVALTGQFTKAP
jgi:hypothetical protein